MGRVFLYCDESGAKGYADNDEAKPGEVGVFAGILVPEEILATVKPAFDQIAKRYKPAEGKLHIADLPLEQKAGLRNEIFAAIQDANLPCFWYAVHVAGLHAGHRAEAKALQQAKDAFDKARAGEEPRFKGGSPRENAESLHVLLFNGLYSRFVAFLLDRGQREVDLQVRTDRVDKPLVQAFTHVAEVLLASDPSVTEIRLFDTVKKKPDSLLLMFNVDDPSGYDVSSVVKTLSIETVPDSDGLVLAADVLANSLNYLFMHRAADQLYGPLNCMEAVENHPLAPNLQLFNSWDVDPVGDVHYAHPKWRQSL